MTEHDFKGLIPEQLLQQIRRKRCVLFAGAGLSIQARSRGLHDLPNWPTLLRRMVDWCTEHRVPLRATTDELLELINRDRLLVVGQELQQSLAGQFETCLSDIFRGREVAPGDAHRQVCRTDWAAVFTSNYDTLIEGAYAATSEGALPPVLTSESIGQALANLRAEKFFVFKVHGDLNVRDSIKLGSRDYSNLLYLHPAYRSFLETVFSSYTVLFLGFGGTDPDLFAVIDRLSALYERSINQHFLLIPQDRFTRLERWRFLEDKRLDCITYPTDPEHSQVVEFLRAIAVRTAPGAPEPRPFKESADRPRAYLTHTYRPSDIAAVSEVTELVKEAGFDIWVVPPSAEYPGDEIGRAIDECDVVVAVITEHAAQSRWVSFELGRAWGARKRVVAIRFGDATIPSDLYGLSYFSVGNTPLTDSSRQALKRLLDEAAMHVRGS